MPNVGDQEQKMMGELCQRRTAKHVGLGDQLFSNFPYLRPIATITHDTLDWYGFDAFGGSVHDVIGTRCDPYTHNLLSHGGQFHHCCHSNLTRSLAKQTGLSFGEAEFHVHDVLNVFMCTGFTRDTGQYFVKASPVRQGDYLEYFAEIDLLGNMSACPGGDCSSKHPSDEVACYHSLPKSTNQRLVPTDGKSPYRMAMTKPRRLMHSGLLPVSWTSS